MSATLIALVGLGGGAHAGGLEPELRTYFDYRQDLSEDTADAGQFVLGRTYIGGRGELAPGLRARVTADLGRMQDGGQLEFFAKYSYAEIDLVRSGDLRVRVGVVPRPLPDFAEASAQHRFVRASFADQYGLAAGADLGAVLHGRLGDGLVDADLGIFNGPGFRRPELDPGKLGSAMVVVHPLIGHDTLKALYVGGQGSYERYSSSVENYDWVRLIDWRGGAAALMGWRSERLQLLGEAHWRWEPATADLDTQPLLARGVSATAQGHIATGHELYGDTVTIDPLLRVDAFDRDGRMSEDGVADDRREVALVGGVGVTLSQHFRLMLDYQQVLPGEGSDDALNWRAEERLYSEQDVPQRVVYLHTRLQR